MRAPTDVPGSEIGFRRARRRSRRSNGRSGPGGYRVKGKTTMSDAPPGREFDIWRRLDESYQSGDRTAFELALSEFRSVEVDRVALLKRAFGARYRPTWVYLTQYLRASELENLLPELVFLASWAHGATKWIRDLILSLPRDRVLERVQSTAEPLLENGTDDEYRRLLELYYDLDRNLAVSLARRAARHSDPHIKEAGEEFLEVLGAS